MNYAESRKTTNEIERFVFKSLEPLMEEFLNDPIIIDDFQRSIGQPYPSADTIKEFIKEFFVKLTVDGETSKDRKKWDLSFQELVQTGYRVEK